LDPFLPLFWPLIIFWVNFLYIFICAYIHCVIILKIALINGISIGIFNFYHFDLFWTLFDPVLPTFGLLLYLVSNSKVFKIHKKHIWVLLWHWIVYFSTIILRVGSIFFCSGNVSKLKIWYTMYGSWILTFFKDIYINIKKRPTENF